MNPSTPIPAPQSKPKHTPTPGPNQMLMELLERAVFVDGTVEYIRKADVLAVGERIMAKFASLQRKLDALPADWSEDSSLATWFPITAKRHAALIAEVAKLRETLADALQLAGLVMRQKEAGNTQTPDNDWFRAAALYAESIEARAALASATGAAK